MYLYLNGEYILESEAGVSVFDRGFLYGDGLFETMRAYKGHIFRLDQHMQRLFKGLELLRIKNAWTGSALKHVLYRLLELNKLKDAYIRLTVSRGVGGRGIDIAGCDNPTIVINSREFLPYPESLYRDGVRACISEKRMNCRNPIDSQIKSLNFLNNILVRMEASERGVFEAVMLNHKGYLTEGTVSNLFFVIEGVLYTPSPEAGILEGITRQVVLEVAAEKGITVEEGLFSTKELCEAEEVFLTNSLIEIMPVSGIESKMYVRGRITRITERLMNAYKEQVDEEILAG
ncbi:MAG TPA: aminodeoxychorismate lyase [Nitrospirae bacterium]|nr:aminodeoxychorismate lyase [Nitrospirota bacterium]